MLEKKKALVKRIMPPQEVNSWNNGLRCAPVVMSASISCAIMCFPSTSFEYTLGGISFGTGTGTGTGTGAAFTEDSVSDFATSEEVLSSCAMTLLTAPLLCFFCDDDDEVADDDDDGTSVTSAEGGGAVV